MQNLKQSNDCQPKTCIYLSVGWSLLTTTVAQHVLSCVETDPQGDATCTLRTTNMATARLRQIQELGVCIGLSCAKEVFILLLLNYSSRQPYSSNHLKQVAL